ncbi:response regulator [Orrella sp. JC864]|uniref:response regulator n=1 Tax=Orrella sp. JC864 TaxID=3120298 RepID=UPI0012BBC426
MGATILVADDSATMRLIVESTLRAAGWQVVTASDGGEALDVLGSCPVDLVVTDWHMSPLSGQDLAWALRARPATALLPIVVLSTESPSVWAELAQELSLSYWLRKPLDPELLVQTVRTALHSSNPPEDEATRP